ncbi:hypothetical protein E1293_25940 [Actinomadura darangshiensis]|uniref:Uncharacterized protein n=1 Tax=Actinomadura darangshiensis TaxID=705336 RepID=A0A4V2YUH4_9ACTN|nr:hypothetical protein [Actinomadura darangshiensis]TDD77697.1 hypothetical protein E1293_25940 [Actinomadura darangshiensis]
MTADRRYDRRALIRAYLDELRHRNAAEPKDPESDYAKLAEYERNLSAGLQRLFEIDLSKGMTAAGTASGDRFLLNFLRSTALSHLAIQHPWSGYLEAGGVVTAMKDAGLWDAVQESTDRIIQVNRDSEREHMEILDLLVRHLLGDRADRSFTSADLRALGVPDEPPVDPDDMW